MEEAVGGRAKEMNLSWALGDLEGPGAGSLGDPLPSPGSVQVKGTRAGGVAASQGPCDPWVSLPPPQGEAVTRNGC